MSTMLVARRVCRNWNAVIADSAVLQRAAFSLQGWKAQEITEHATSTTQLNGLVSKILDPLFSTAHLSLPPGFDAPEASWRNKSLFCPPARELVLHFDPLSGHGSTGSTMQEGLTLGCMWH